VLRHESLDTIGKLAAATPAELLRMPNFGHQLLAALVAVLADLGLALQCER
jgi:DNA-directed RNA polymerase alpha subunit